MQWKDLRCFKLVYKPSQEVSMRKKGKEGGMEGGNKKSQADIKTVKHKGQNQKNNIKLS